MRRVVLSPREWHPSSFVSKLVQQVKPVSTPELIQQLFIVVYECGDCRDWNATGRLLISNAIKANPRRKRSVITALDNIYEQHRLSDVHGDLGYILEWCFAYFLRVHGRRLLGPNKERFSVVMQSRVIDSQSGQAVVSGPGDEDRTLDVTAAYVDSSGTVICAMGFESKYNLGTAITNTEFHRQLQYLDHLSKVVAHFRTFIAVCTEFQVIAYSDRYSSLCRSNNIADVPLFSISNLIEGG